MKNPILGLTVLLLALGASTAVAQTPPTTVKQRAASPARTTPASAVVQPVAKPLQTQQYAVAGKQTVPSNLFGVEDRAIIIVGGKPLAAGDVKRQVATELRQLSTPATASYRRAVAGGVPTGAPVRDLPGAGKGFQLKDRVAANAGVSSAARAGSTREALVVKPAMSYMDAINYCKTHPADISRVRGTVTPNGRFTIEGMCFGDQTGVVEAIGQFPGGNMKLVFERWTDGQIVAFVPPVSGAPDHTIALTVVRPDKTRSPAVQARFHATRQQVPVPPRFWSPSHDFVRIEVDQGGGDIFSGFKVWGAGAESRITPFTLLINPACELDSAAWSSSTGRVDAFNGWDNAGPPNQANVEIVWTPRCVTQTTNYIVASSSQRICSVEFSLAAWANCPVGLTP